MKCKEWLMMETHKRGERKAATLDSIVQIATENKNIQLLCEWHNLKGNWLDAALTHPFRVTLQRSTFSEYEHSRSVHFAFVHKCAREYYIVVAFGGAMWLVVLLSLYKVMVRVENRLFYGPMAGCLFFLLSFALHRPLFILKQKMASRKTQSKFP